MAYKDPEKRREAQRRWRASGKLPLAIRQCEYCGAEYEPRKPWSKFCSRPCQYRAKSPVRSPEPAADGTPWHLREDLGRKEWQLLTPEQKRERKLLQHREHEAIRRATPKGEAYRDAYNVAKSIRLGRRGPDRAPHPAEDGTPWHLRRDLYVHEITALTPEEKVERNRSLWRDKATRMRGARPPRPMRERIPAEDGTPWHLRGDLTKGEARQLTAEQAEQRRRAWCEVNRDKRLEQNREWYTNNPDKARALSVRKAASRRNATPPWVDLNELAAIWVARPEGHHVDHIRPVKGRHWRGKLEPGDDPRWLERSDDTRVSYGLNVPWNLQYLPDTENSGKRNRQPQPGYFDWFSETSTVHTEPQGLVWTPTDYDNI